MDADERGSAERGAYYVLAMQLRSVCEAIRVAVQCGHDVGPSTIAMLKDMRDELVSHTSGKPSDRIPSVTEEMSPCDLLAVLAVAEVAHSTVLTCLTLEEAKEQRDTFGFHTL